MNLPLTHAPDFPYHFQWFNTPQPLTLHDELTGYVVLVYFWTPTSAHCQSMFPTVAYLGQRFAGRAFVAIGVHAARFAAEADLELIGRALRRYGIRHPVVVDEHRHLWEEYGCRGWPHSVLVDATGTVRFSGSGEPDRERMAAAIEFLLDDAAAQGDEPYTHLRFSDTEPPEGLSGLSAPAGIAADPRRGLLWVADTGHHRVVAVDVESGQVTVVVGCGEPGAGDGSFDQATFFLPRALALHGDGVLVADTGNHLVRRLDPSTRQVTTVLGTGRSVADPHAGAAGRAQPLHAPQGLAAAADAVFVAVAGTHQVWRVDPTTWATGVVAGSGVSGEADGAAAEATLAQPFGLARAGQRLAFVDSQSGALRMLDLAARQVRTLAAGRLDGNADDLPAELQQPCAVAWHGDDLLVTDTLEDAIRRYPAGGGAQETVDVSVRWPEALAVDDEVLWVADTGNDRIVRVDLRTGETAVLALRGLPDAPTAFGTVFAAAQPIRLAPHADVDLVLPMDLCAGAMLQPGTTAILFADNLEGAPLSVDAMVAPDVDDGRFVARGLASGDEGRGVLRLRLLFATCQESGQVCHVHERRLDVPVEVVADGATRTEVLPRTTTGR